MKAHRNLPFFVPFAGCPNCCVFCSQTKITGKAVEKDAKTEIDELRSLLESEQGRCEESQIAFFGGSFTAIERERMISLLSIANEYIEKGIAGSIRISTRPDCIDEGILALLKQYRVKNIELGIQSTDDFVLEASGRGHDSFSSFKSAELIKKHGIDFCGQMMIGLPNSTPASEVQTARDIVKMGASEARIYPTVVFEGTKLYDMTRSGEYIPLTLDDAVERTAKCYKIFLDAGVKMLRIGLHASENLKNAPYGAKHEAIGELVKSYVYCDIIKDLAGNCEGRILDVTVRRADLSMLCGHGGYAIARLKRETGCEDVKISCADIPQFKPLISTRSV
ncbi:MAG: radical SAM protein [Clostridia bacterium]|nr:radical SAM protein [Clostridia bacterium]